MQPAAISPEYTSPEYTAAEQRYALSRLAERLAWEDARGRLPGTPHFDAQRWEEWQACVARTAQSRRALLAMIRIDQ